jgi:hypothetical protein
MKKPPGSEAERPLTPLELVIGLCVGRNPTASYFSAKQLRSVYPFRGCFVFSPKKLVRFLEANWLKLVIFAAIGVAIIWAVLPRRKPFRERRPPGSMSRGPSLVHPSTGVKKKSRADKPRRHFPST